ncbi:MAG: hypothetical protein R3312_05935, partial [Gammaproteobacteria bacterium]|nr:hypothetical protein [Gammaproteobacteria bacterium]
MRYQFDEIYPNNLNNFFESTAFMINSFFSKSLLILAFLFFAFSISAVHAADKDQREVEGLIAEDEAPDGVVFELLGNEGDYLLVALEKVKAYTDQLQKKFPGVDIAVVSHGAEQFNLTRDNQPKAEAAHAHVQQLVASDVPV